MRFTYNSADDLRPILKDLSEAEFAQLDFGSYPEEAFFDDMFRITSYRTDPELCEQLVKIHTARRNGLPTKACASSRGSLMPTRMAIFS